jgi:hypothetical protein
MVTPAREVEESLRDKQVRLGDQGCYIERESYSARGGPEVADEVCAVSCRRNDLQVLNTVLGKGLR